MAWFQTLFGSLVHSLLHRIHDNDHVLVQPHTGCMVVWRPSPEPQDRVEGPAPPEAEEPVRGPAMGEYQAEGTPPWGRQAPTEGPASQKAEEPAAKALGNASKSWEDGACVPFKFQDGEWHPSPQALEAPTGAPSSKAGALINLQAQYAQVEAQFYRDSHDLEKKYAAFYQPLFDKRSEIINAIHEPTEGECQWQVGEPVGEGHTNGIPYFWLTAFKNVKILSRMIQKNDELVLEHLEDIHIEFIFKSNEYFFNKVLTKTYQMQSDPDDSDPFFSKGPEIISSTDVTVKTSKLQRGKGHRSFASTTRTMLGYSFFTYFYPPHSPEGREMDVTTDYKLGYFFREVLVPKSVLFFTNEARDCNYESADDDAREAGGEEKKVEVIRNEEFDKGPRKDLDPEESSC
ncbi:unnamed protein product [Nyctereutes procyonoides]|uniref:(raccoon dog) hypothetical protein n=1 Tax=Nyctereutes procyonoides TaxID=34880 RepID=A0A811Z0K0_NYCPR|nr:unnamed protein product [Nyctereutes procyonoides]